MKPDDISQEVWVDALAALPKPGDRFNEHGVTVSVARAIMAAKEEAYTDAEELAKRMGAGRRAQSEQAKTAKQPKVARDFESMAMSAFDVAAAIRARGK